MENGHEVVVVSGVRTAVGKYGGSLKDFPASELAAMVVKEAVARAGIAPETVQHAVFGNVIHTDVHDHYLARYAAVRGGLSENTPAFTLNRLCGSGLQAVVSASQLIMVGDVDTAIAGGAEVMSRSQYWMPSLRWGARMNDATVIDAMVGALSDPFDDCHMGITAENVAKKWEVSREDQDALSVESHKRAAHAIEQGYFKSQIMPVEIAEKKTVRLFDTDEFVRLDATVEGMAKLRPVFDKAGTVTAGNASGVNDAAAALVLMERKKAEDQGLKVMGRLVAYGFAGVDPKYMGIGPVPAVRNAMERAGLTVADMDVIELNEAFAAQALAVMRELEMPEDKTNPNGSGISIGHPIGATGAMLVVKALNELERIAGRYALVTMCIGGGQGIAAIFERL
ncbi:MAG: acetyl-CoA C-acyltransferase family protein [Chloroflexaceae bacterium]|nr:acetyl-CoA C-acyltransferase family protein [Chloroflexaceae bacterium]NJO04942.1 acetyl-CoA C-acyltransferase family protein [Chloroflexaceae bacterium]